MAKQLWKPGNILNPVPVVMVSVADEKGKANIITVAWAGTVCTNPPMVSISVRPSRFSYDLIRGAYESIRKKDMTGVTDDAMVVEQETGTKILLVEGSYRNIKITTPEDLAVAEAFLQY